MVELKSDRHDESDERSADSSTLLAENAPRRRAAEEARYHGNREGCCSGERGVSRVSRVSRVLAAGREHILDWRGGRPWAHFDGGRAARRGRRRCGRRDAGQRGRPSMVCDNSLMKGHGSRRAGARMVHRATRRVPIPPPVGSYHHTGRNLPPHILYYHILPPHTPQPSHSHPARCRRSARRQATRRHDARASAPPQRCATALHT